VQEDGELDALMARLADGDRQAFTPVFRRLWGPVLRLCTSILKNNADAADAAQQAMTKILERASGYDSTRAAMPWALAIASWECRTTLRRRSRRRESFETKDAEPAGEAFEEVFARRELAEAAAHALGELSDVDRETLVATFWEEAATEGGATLRKRRQRALVKLRRAWRRLYGLD
jgi:RNA polymerase sigma-70 factor (ECF subfamily)